MLVHHFNTACFATRLSQKRLACFTARLGLVAATPRTTPSGPPYLARILSVAHGYRYTGAPTAERVIYATSLSLTRSITLRSRGSYARPISRSNRCTIPPHAVINLQQHSNPTPTSSPHQIHLWPGAVPVIASQTPRSSDKSPPLLSPLTINYPPRSMVSLS